MPNHANDTRGRFSCTCRVILQRPVKPPAIRPLPWIGLGPGMKSGIQKGSKDPCVKSPLLLSIIISHSQPSAIIMDSKAPAPYHHVAYLPASDTDIRESARKDVSTGSTVILGSHAGIFSEAIHVIPLAVSAFVVYISINRWYWFGELGPGDAYLGNFVSFSVVQNLLQLAAKFHELMVIASLSVITLRVYKRHLVESYAPLGLLTAGYRVSDVRYLFERPFWSSLRPDWTILFLAGIVLLNTVITTLIGPASAILVVPALDWYPLPNPFDKIKGPISYTQRLNDTWPKVLEPTRVIEGVGALEINQTARNKQPCLHFESSLHWHCPNAGYPQIRNWLSGWENSALSPDLIFDEPSGTVRRRLLIRSSDHAENEDPRVTYTTTISTPSMLTIGRFLNYIKLYNDTGSITARKNLHFNLTTTGNFPIYQPVVQTQCRAHNFESVSLDEPPSFSADGLSCLDDDECEIYLQQIKSGADRIPADRLMSSIGSPAHILGLAQGERNHNALVMSLTLPYSENQTKKAWLVGCTVLAHWVPSTLSISPKDSEFVQSNITDPALLFRPGPDLGTAINVNFTSNWTRYLDPIIWYSNDTVDRVLRTLYTTPMLGGVFIPGSSEGRANNATAAEFIQKILGVVVTEGLARSTSLGETNFLKTENDTMIEWEMMAHLAEGFAWSGRMDFSNGTAVRTGSIGDQDASILIPGLTMQMFRDQIASTVRFEFQAQRYGYGSGKRGPTMTFALAVVFIYFVIVGCYFLDLVILSRLYRGDRGSPPTVLGWGTLPELLVLVWNSRPHPTLGRSSVRVQGPAQAWKLRTGILADDHGAVQLVTDDDERGMTRLRKNAKYH
ncbi:hypothetical protein V8F20_012411 [Naviculisporaceae sp. PSN 640]